MYSPSDIQAASNMLVGNPEEFLSGFDRSVEEAIKDALHSAMHPAIVSFLVAREGVKDLIVSKAIIVSDMSAVVQVMVKIAVMTVASERFYNRSQPK